jgi:hypothetical protein
VSRRLVIPVLLLGLVPCSAAHDEPFGTREPPPDDTVPFGSTPPPPDDANDLFGAPGFPIDLAQAAALFVQARDLSDADGGALWGKPLYGPMMFVDPATRSAVMNTKPRGDRFEQRGNVWIGRLPDSVSLGNTATQWNGRRWSMVLWPISANTTWSGTLMMHESFHRLQPELGIPLAVPKNHHLDGAPGRLWLRLEWRALAAALAEDDSLASDALRDAFIFRHHRQALINGSMHEERALELNEGLAEYTGMRLGGADDDAQLQYAIRGLKSYDNTGPLVRRFAYAMGPPYGLLLDRARPDWREDVHEKSDLSRMLQRAVRFRRPPALAAEALERAGRYGYDALLTEEAAREAARQDRLDAYRARYIDAPVLVLEMGGAYNYSFSPYNVHAMDGIGTVYGTMQLNAPWGVLDAPGGVLVVEDRKGRRRVIVPAPQDPDARPLAGDGWTVRLASGWRLGPGLRPSDYRLVKAGRRP